MDRFSVLVSHCISIGAPKKYNRDWFTDDSIVCESAPKKYNRDWFTVDSIVWLEMAADPNLIEVASICSTEENAKRFAREHALLLDANAVANILHDWFARRTPGRRG